MTAPPHQVYPTLPLPELHDLLSREPNWPDSTVEAIADRLGCDPWDVEAVLEALTVNGEVLS